MKKYLMTGIAAITLCAGFTSCSHDVEQYTQEEINQFEAQKILQNYEQAFINAFGQPAANKDWGFGVKTRTRGVFANGNEWAANDRDDCRYKVPPALTPEQRNVVIKYFQTVPNLDYNDPQWEDYFIQQVYKGGPSTAGNNSAEQYAAANGSTMIIGSDHMDHLAAIDPARIDPETGETFEFVDHNNNFNAGDCGSGYPNVLDYVGTLTEVKETYPVNDATHRHSDKINLMLNSTTKSFGYYNSNSSVRRTEYTGLVSYQQIIYALGAEANCLNDGWNRSFMGFDFEMMIGEDLYQKNWQDGSTRYVKISDIPGNAPQYIWDGENVIKWWDTDESWNRVYAEGYDEYIKIGGQKIPYLVTETNLYAGDRLDAQSVLENITQTNLKVTQNGVECLNLPVIKAAFEAGYYPTKDSAQDWVKVGGTADGYYSDWIVTLTKAEQYTVTDDPIIPDDPVIKTKGDLRVIAEDLTVEANGDASDFDFNDVVFDVYYGDASTAKVKILAAGGTLQLKVNGTEVHTLLGHPGKMINTQGTKSSDANVRAKSVDDVEPQDILLGFAVNNAQDAKNIVIEVNKGTNGQDNWVALTAERGKAASKVAVDPEYQWNAERQSMPASFKQYVTSTETTYDEWWRMYENQ